MSKIGIMRYGCDNDYMFIAEAEVARVLNNVAVYHQSNSSCMGWNGPFKSLYEHAQLTNGERILRYKDGVIFSGDEPIPVFDITEEVYKAIFDHSDDVGKILQRSRQRLAKNQRPTLFGWINRGKFASKKVKEEDYLRIEEQLREHPPRPETLEYDRAFSAAIEAGFNGRIINGRPRAVGMIISVQELLNESLPLAKTS